MLLAISAWRSHRLILCLAAGILIASAGGVGAEEPSTPSEAGSTASDAQNFCANIVDAAGDARFAWEAKTLKDLQSQLESATAALEEKRVALQELLKRRDEFQKLAEQSVVDIYSKMRPEAAAAQLGALDERTAAAVLIKLNSRTASAILAEMEIPRAVSLAQLISGGGEAEETGVARQ